MIDKDGVRKVDINDKALMQSLSEETKQMMFFNVLPTLDKQPNSRSPKRDCSFKKRTKRWK